MVSLRTLIIKVCVCAHGVMVSWCHGAACNIAAFFGLVHNIFSKTV